jgi:hypothetical protein
MILRLQQPPQQDRSSLFSLSSNNRRRNKQARSFRPMLLLSNPHRGEFHHPGANVVFIPMSNALARSSSFSALSSG